MTEEECERLRRLAHDAPLNPYHLDADGHRWVEMRSYAWARTGRDWVRAKGALEASRKTKRE
jgi:hypothetical protein